MFFFFFYSPRGYYPRGGGEILVRVSPVKYLKPINLTDRGSVVKIYGRAFVAGVLPYKVSVHVISMVRPHTYSSEHVGLIRSNKYNYKISRSFIFSFPQMVKDMISAAVRCIRRELRDLYVNIQGVQEPGDKAVGNGSGIM